MGVLRPGVDSRGVSTGGQGSPVNFKKCQYHMSPSLIFYYPPEVRSMKYCKLGVFMQQYSLLVNCLTIMPFKCIDIEIIWVVKIRNASEAVLGPQYTPQGHHTDRSPVGLGQYDGQGEYIVALILPPLCFV